MNGGIIILRTNMDFGMKTQAYDDSITHRYTHNCHPAIILICTHTYTHTHHTPHTTHAHTHTHRRTMTLRNRRLVRAVIRWVLVH